MNVAIEVIVGIFILLGVILSLLSVFGFVRLPDVYTRNHASTKSVTLGLLCILFAGFLYFLLTENYVSIRLILGIVFVFFTAPISGHLICRSAHRAGIELHEISAKDELKAFKEAQNKKA